MAVSQVTLKEKGRKHQFYQGHMKYNQNVMPKDKSSEIACLWYGCTMTDLLKLTLQAAVITIKEKLQTMYEKKSWYLSK